MIKDYELRALERDEEVPIPVSMIRAHMRVHKSVTDDELKLVASQACDLLEDYANKSIFYTKWELTHARPDIYLDKAPVNKINIIKVKKNGKWIKLNLEDEKAVEIKISQDLGRMVYIKQCRENSPVKIEYEAGYKLAYIENGYQKMPASVRLHLLRLCEMIYNNAFDSKGHSVSSENIKESSSFREFFSVRSIF